MFAKQKKWGMMGLFVAMSFAMLRETDACKVLVMTSYSEQFFWSQEIKQGIEQELKDRCELTYAYLETELDPAGVKVRAEKMYALYQTLQPDGVIVEGDDAQIYFVLPYLKDKVTTPVVFAQIYNPPTQYGYPASNVSGVPANARFAESLSFVRQLVPSIKTVAIVFNDNETTRIGTQVVKRTLEEGGVTVLEPFLSNDPEAIRKNAEELKTTIDAIFTGPSLGETNVKILLETAQKPTFTCWSAGLRYGMLAGVIEKGNEVGKLAAIMLKKAMDGTPVAQIPMTSVEFATRMINVDTLKALGIQPSRRVLTGVELIKTKSK